MAAERRWRGLLAAAGGYLAAVLWALARVRPGGEGGYLAAVLWALARLRPGGEGGLAEPAVPLVDLAELRAGAPAAAAALAAAARGKGVARLARHGMGVEAARSAGRAYFSLDERLKGCETCSLWNQSLGLQRGYIPFAAESGLADVLEVKEGFCYGLEWPAERPAVHPHQGRNVWPPEGAMQELGPHWREEMERFFAEAVEASQLVVASLAEGLGQERGAQLRQLCEGGESISQMRLFHYLPRPAAAEKRCLGSSPHTDWHVVTIIARDDASALQFVDRGTGAWVDVPVGEGELVLLVGDWLAAFSGGELHSAAHRVQLPERDSSLAFVFFFNPSPEARLPQAAREAGAGRARQGEPLNSVEQPFFELPWGEYVVQKWAKVMSNR